MDLDKFQTIYDESRNGANEFYQHPLIRSFVITDGVRDCAECGIWWLIDIAATELPVVMRKKDETLGVLTFIARDGKADLMLSGSGDVELWRRHIDFTDMPDGAWTFYIGDDGPRYTMILPSEY